MTDNNDIRDESDGGLRFIYVCYTCSAFVRNEISDIAFVDEEDAIRWMQEKMRAIQQIVGMRDAAEKRYKDSDKAKYESVLKEAAAFERKAGLPLQTWLANYRSVEVR